MDPTLIETQPIPEWSFFDWLVSQAPNLLPIWLPILVAVIALIYSIRSDGRSHKHNRLSVKPILNLRIRISRSPSGFRLDLVNNGIGPAIITGIEFHLDGKPIEQPDSDETWAKLFIKMGIDVSRILAEGRSYGVDYSITAGSCESVIDLTGFKGNDLDHLHNRTKKALTRLKVRYHYSSIYGGEDDGSQGSWSTKLVSLK